MDKAVKNLSGSVVVIGLGRFGTGVAKSLVELGHDVLAIESDADTVQSLSSVLPHVVQADATDLETLRQLAVPDFAHAVVSIGGNLEASVLTILNLSQLGIKDIWAKAIDPQHGRIAERVGAHHVVYPEADMGERVAHLVTGKMIDFIEFDDDFAIVKTRPPRESLNKTLAQSALRTRHGITVVGVKRPRQDFTYAKPDTLVVEGDLLIVSGPTAKVEQFTALP